MVQVYKLIHGIDYINNMEELLQLVKIVELEEIFINWSNHIAKYIEQTRVSSIGL